ncbi:MAG: hypothetical protein WDN00_12035 [Limisphaerales bacterium]
MFLFLPVVLSVYALLRGNRARNNWLLATSLVFYAWGEVVFHLPAAGLDAGELLPGPLGGPA